MSWNYRICTKVEGKGGSTRWRSFSVKEVYYNKEGIPDGVAETSKILEWDNYEDLKGTYKLIEKAFEKPIIDLDNFPEEYKND